MHKKILCLLITLGLCATILTLPLSAAKEEHSVSAKTYFYDQLTEEGKWIYDALTAPEHLDALKRGEAIPVAAHTIAIPEDVNQEQFDALVNELTTEQARLGTIMQYAADATSAINRDRSDIFWTNRVHARVVFAIGGEIQEDNISISPGNEYTVLLLVSLPVAEDWDGDGAYDRHLETDIATLTQAIETVSNEARQAFSTRYEQLRYVNDLLCRINDYHTEAADADEYPQYYPWTALSALSPLDTENDEADGALKPVCEGYARALKLICDALDIPCVLANGQGNGMNHMWNYVQLEDGNWYAIDVTWNDTAQTERYFLRGTDFFSKNHTPTGVFMPGEQTLSFVYPTVSTTDYVVPTTAVGILSPAIPTLTEGYDSLSLSLTLSNYGTQPAQLTAIALSDETAMTLEGALPHEPLAAGTQDASLRLVIRDHLSAGTYTTVVTLTYGEGLTATETITLTVEPKPAAPSPEAPDEPSEKLPDGEKSDESKKDHENPNNAEEQAEKSKSALERLGCRASTSALGLCLPLLALLWPIRKKRNDL